MAVLLNRLSNRIGLRSFGSALKVVTARYVSTNQSYIENGGQMHPFAQLPETHEMLRNTCRNFADSVLKPIAGDIDQNHLYPAKQVQYFVCY